MKPFAIVLSDAEYQKARPLLFDASGFFVPEFRVDASARWPGFVVTGSNSDLIVLSELLGLHGRISRQY